MKSFGIAGLAAFAVSGTLAVNEWGQCGVRVSLSVTAESNTNEFSFRELDIAEARPVTAA
ncbi:hypothetical protein HGRIS_001716 [Hohenbuehelia grisea]|uniref:Uncharacterized protein n=1 Tax=Hohenbuehelia grisea TaxID=104357 RepID=A0ABR3JI88_9AGAR